MADHPRQIVEGALRFVQHGVQTVGQRLHGKAEDGLSIHRDGCGACAGRPAGVEHIAAARAQRERKGGVRQPEDCGTGSISEQHTGGAVGRVHQAGKCFAPNDQRILPAQCCQQAPRHAYAVEEAGTGRVDVQRRPVFGQAQSRLHLAGHTGGGVRRRQRGADAAGNVRRGKAAALQCLFCRPDGQRRSRFFVCAPVPGADACAAGDPFIAGVHHAAQVLVCDRPARQCPAGGDQLQTLHAFLVSPIWRYFL